MSINQIKYLSYSLNKDLGIPENYSESNIKGLPLATLEDALGFIDSLIIEAKDQIEDVDFLTENVKVTCYNDPTGHFQMETEGNATYEELEEKIEKLEALYAWLESIVENKK